MWWSVRTLGSCLWALALLVACSPELERYERRPSKRGTLGEEVYKVLCRRMAGTAYPDDITGSRTRALCLGDEATVARALAAERYEPRLEALADRRRLIADAVDDTFAGSLSDPLEQLFAGLLPYYDAPEERVQESTRALASVLERIAGTSDDQDGADPEALAGLARLLREGSASTSESFGLVRAILGAPHFGEMAGAVLPHTDDEAVKPSFDAMLSGLALMLATAEPDAEDERDIADLKALLLETHPDFASGTPLHALLRDERGHFVPTPSETAAVPYPFLDDDGDGLADEKDGILSAETPLPAPFPAVGERGVERDDVGRARALMPDGGVDPSRLLYRTTDLDATLLGGALRVMRGMFRDDQLTRGLASALGPIVGETVETSERYGAFDLRYRAPDPAKSPLLDLIHAVTATVDQPVIGDALTMSERLLSEQEPALVSAIAPLLGVERRTRWGSDAYPNARLKPGHTFWNELLFEVEKLSRRRLTANGETLLEALTRSALGDARNLQKPGQPIERIIDPELLAHQGGVYATLMRFRDEWHANPKPSSARAPDEPEVLGGFRTPVDRDAPDAPVRCGRDGCGGLVADTPFARWAAPNQQCVIQRSGRPVTGRDCGAPANQSIFHRSLGLMAEMAGRAQCNKALTVQGLIEQAIEDPCVGEIAKGTPACEQALQKLEAEREANVKEAEEAVRSYTCPATALFAPCRRYAQQYPSAFIDPDGPGGVPSTISACHLLNLPDVGRAFGAVITGEFTIDIPNPWVRRYLEDIARAGDHNGDGAPDLPVCRPGALHFNFPIVDPAIPPSCTPEAAKLARDMYKGMPPSVSTLGELIAYLLDNPKLFVTEEDRRLLRPDPKALSRVLFTSSEGSGFQLFDPPLLRHAPKACAEAPGLPACAMDDSQPIPEGGCCIADPSQPPLRFRLDTYYGGTTYAWELPLRLVDGRTISFLDTMKPVTDAVRRFDFDAARDDRRAVEDTSYVLSTLGRLVAEHYDTAANPAAQDRDPNGMGYRRLTGLASYEAMFADALDDGALDPTQPGPDGSPLFASGIAYGAEQQHGLLAQAMTLLSALDAMDFGNGRDGIDLSAELAEQSLNGHARCAGATGDRRVIAGEGACDRALRGEPGFTAPLAQRDGRTHVCYRDGRCFDGAKLPRHYTAPLHQLVEALGAMGLSESADPAREGALHGVIAGVVDALFSTSDGQFADRRAVRLMHWAIAELREKIAEEQRAGTLATLRTRTDEDAAELLHDPVVAGALGVWGGLHGQRDATRALARFFEALLGGDDEAHLRPLIVGAFDALQLLPADDRTLGLMHALANSFATGAERVVQRGGAASTLNPQKGAVARNLFMLRETARRDETAVLDRVLHNLTSVTKEGAQAPLLRLFDALLETNRVTPGAEGSPTAEDLASMLRRVSAVMRDEQHGFERLYETVRCTRQPNADGCGR